MTDPAVPTVPTDPLRWLILATHVNETGTGGGMVRYTVELIRHLSQTPGIEIHVVCNAGGAGFFHTKLSIPDNRIHTLPTSNVIAMSLLERFGLHRVFREPWDVVHGFKHLVPKWANASLRVLTVHDTILLDRPLDFGRLKRSLLRRQYIGSVRDADKIVCVSEAAQSRIEAHAPDVVGRTAVVRLAGAALSDVKPQPVECLINQEFALVVGDPSPRKNLQLLAAVWPAVTERVPSAKLAVIGPTGWGTNAGRDEIAQLVDDGKAIQLGHVSDGQLRWAYENATVTLCPSLLEGFGLPVVEALAAGSNVISSSDPAQVEAARHSDADPESFVHIPVTDRVSWATAIVDRFSIGPAHGRTRSDTQANHHPTRTWRTVANETEQFIRASKFTVVQANKAYAPRVGGVETVIRDIAIGIADRGLNSTVIAAGEDSTSGVTREDGVRIRRSRTLFRARSVPFAPGMIRALKRERGDALLIHEPSIITMLTFLLARRTPHRRLVIWWHFEVNRQKLLWVLVRKPMMHMLSKADAIITATPHHVSSSEVLPKFKEKVSYVPFGIDLPKWRELAESPCPVEATEPFVLFVGRLVYYKGIPEFLNVVDLLPNTRFVMVGSGPLESLVRSHPAFHAGQIELLQHVTDAQLAALMKAARVFAFSSATETEAFGIVQSQSMALGTPVVGFDLPTGTTWVNQHDVTGTIVARGDCEEFASAVARILTDENHYARLSAGAVERANSEFGFELYIDRVLEVLRG
jgi:glycosyltransferase involved in cell wall biosynthesis